MDPHFTRKPPTPPGPSSGSGGGAAGSSGNFISAANGSASSSSSVLMTDADGLRLYQNSNGSSSGSSISGSSGTEQQRETEDQLQLAIKNTLACVRVLLNQPRASDLVRGFIGQSLAPANSTTNSSHLIDLRSLEASAAAHHHHHHHLLSDDSLSSLNVTSTVQSASADSISDTSAAAASARVDLLGLYDRLPASTGSLPLDALSHEWQVLLVVIYSLTAISSFLLNMITLVVLSRCQRTELRKYLINLSLSDLLMSMFSIPFTYTEYMLGHWLFGAFLCPFIRFVVTLSVFVSIATMTVIGINRHLAIMYPLKRKNSPKWKHWRSWNKTHVIVGIWVLGTAISLPEYLAFAELPFCYNNLLYYECRNTWPDQIANPYTIFIFLSTFAIPLALLSYLYTSIGLKLWRRQMPGNVDVNRDLTMQTKRAKVVKMLLVVVVLFAVMWLPLQTFSMVNFLYPDIRGNTEYASLGYNIFVGTYFGCHWLGMAHSCVSPLVYCFMNKKFRTDLRNLLCPLRALVGGGGGAGGTGHSGLAGSKSGMYESYNSATFRTSLHHNNNGGNNNNSQSHLPAHLRHNSVRQRAGASSNTHSMNSNSVRVRGSSGVNSTQHSFASRRLSKTNSLSSLGRTSGGGGGASRCLVVGPQSSNELGKSSTSAESEVKSAATTTCMNQTSEQSRKQVVDDHEHQDRPKQSELSPPPVQGKSVSHKGHEVAPPSSDDTVLVKMKTSVQNCLYDRQVLMCKLSHETSATETLHEIDEESEEDDDEEEDDDDDDDDDDDEVDFEMNCETGSGRRVTIRHHKCDYAIMESGPGAILSSNGSNNNDDDRDGHGHERMANV